MIKKVGLFANNNDFSKKTVNLLKKKLIKNGFEVVDEAYDLAIAIGGDGSFLRMVKQTIFASNIYYIGVNTGNLGFLQMVKPDQIDLLIEKLKNQDFKVDGIGIQETQVETKDTIAMFYSLNEIVIRDQGLNTMKMKIFIDDVFLENYVGDGLLIATSVGSTAYNLSYGGSIVYNTFHTLQITPMAPLNTKTYRSLLNSVIIPENKQVDLFLQGGNLLITIDGENSIYENVLKVSTVVNQKRIFCLRFKDYEYTNIIQDKFLKN